MFSGAPSAVVLDLGLPDMDGKAVIAAIREWSDVPIVVVSVRSNEAEIIAALERSDFRMVYQPIVNSATGALFGLEALIRWRPSGREIPAAEIIALAEDSGQAMKAVPSCAAAAPSRRAAATPAPSMIPPAATVATSMAEVSR